MQEILKMNRLTSPALLSVEPPNAPWRLLSHADPPTGYLAFYISDDLSSVPVRAVTLPRNNKSDPNLETGTFGVFSICEREMRTSIVKNGVRFIFFITRRKNSRAITGFYDVRWFCESPFGSNDADYALAAHRQHFVLPAVRIEDLPRRLRASASRRFRSFKRLAPTETAELLNLLAGKPDRRLAYLAEIDRLERFNKYHSGYRYVDWLQPEPFSWETAQEYLLANNGKSKEKRMLNSSPTGFWQCRVCRLFVRNKALLKKCPHCSRIATLRPVMALAIEGHTKE